MSNRGKEQAFQVSRRFSDQESRVMYRAATLAQLLAYLNVMIKSGQEMILDVVEHGQTDNASVELEILAGRLFQTLALPDGCVWQRAVSTNQMSDLFTDLSASQLPRIIQTEASPLTSDSTAEPIG